jgi:thioredoxin 1
MIEYWYFSAKWCAPCKQLAPIMEQVSKTIPVKKIDVDSESGLASSYGIRSVPTVILMKDGSEFKRIIGVKSLGEYLAL